MFFSERGNFTFEVYFLNVHYGSPRTASHLPTVLCTSARISFSGRVRKEQARGLSEWSAAHFSGVFYPQEKLALRQQLDGVKQQLVRQAEYCTEMGAATCTLLWGVSSSEDVVKAMLGGVSTAGTQASSWGLQHGCGGTHMLHPFLSFAHQVVLEKQWGAPATWALGV